MDKKSCLIGFVILIIGIGAGYVLGKKCAAYRANQPLYVTYSEAKNTTLNSFVERVAAQCRSWPKIKITANNSHFVAHCVKRK